MTHEENKNDLIMGLTKKRKSFYFLIKELWEILVWTDAFATVAAVVSFEFIWRSSTKIPNECIFKCLAAWEFPLFKQWSTVKQKTKKVKSYEFIRLKRKWKRLKKRISKW